MTTGRGFTLIEVLIAIALLAALVGSMFAFLHDTIATRDRIQHHAARRRATTTVIDRLERDLATVVAADASAGSGFRGTATRLELLVRSVPARLAGGAAPGLALGDLESVEYRFERGRFALRRGAVGASEARDAVPLEGTVRHARFRYHDGRAWSDAFDSGGVGLPRAVEIAVWYEWAPESAGDGASDSGGGDGFDPGLDEPGSGEPGFDDGRAEDEADDASGAGLEEYPPLPDRVRVIVIPDAQEATP